MLRVFARIVLCLKPLVQLRSIGTGTLLRCQGALEELSPPTWGNASEVMVARYGFSGSPSSIPALLT